MLSLLQREQHRLRSPPFSLGDAVHCSLAYRTAASFSTPPRASIGMECTDRYTCSESEALSIAPDAEEEPELEEGEGEVEP